MYILFFRVLFIAFIATQFLLTAYMINKGNRIKKEDMEFYFFWYLFIFSKSGRKKLTKILKEI